MFPCVQRRSRKLTTIREPCSQGFILVQRKPECSWLRWSHPPQSPGAPRDTYTRRERGPIHIFLRKEIKLQNREENLRLSTHWRENEFLMEEDPKTHLFCFRSKHKWLTLACTARHKETASSPLPNMALCPSEFVVLLPSPASPLVLAWKLQLPVEALLPT